MWNQDIYNSALKYAAHAHQGQKITGTDLPYIIHCVSVCMEIIHSITGRNDINQDLAVKCALLHDTIEDTNTNYTDLMNTFDEETAEGVLSLTKNIDLPKSRRIADSLERIRKSPVEIQMVKLADRITNLSPPPPQWSRQKIIDYHSDAIMIYDALNDADAILSKRLMEKIKCYRIFTGK